MQTFLPYEDFAATAHVLDNRRLDKQRLDVLKILRIITGEPSGWQRHSVVQMWWDYPYALGIYGGTICMEWLGRGFKDDCYRLIVDCLGEAFDTGPLPDEMPPWLGFPDLHISHQSALVRKDPERYGPQFPHVPPTFDLVWPVP